MEKLEKTVQEFNRLHGSEALIRIVEVRREDIIMESEGSVCKTCGLYDCFEDIKWARS
ncbi:hypothetical protein [Thermococcus sp.]